MRSAWEPMTMTRACAQKFYSAVLRGDVFISYYILYSKSYLCRYVLSTYLDP